MKYLIFVFIILFFAIYGGLSYYIGLRTWQNLGSFIPFLNSKVYWGLFWVAVASYVAAQLLDRYMPSVISRGLELVGSYWLAIMFYLIMVLPLIDLIRFINRKARFLSRGLSENDKSVLVVAIVILVALTGILIYGTWSGRSSKVSTYNIDIHKKAGNLDKLKVVMVSDIHLGSIVDNSRLTKMVDRINELKPDVILIPGDIIDSRLEPFTRQKMGQNFRRLKARYGVFASLGNHEAIGGNLDVMMKQYEEAGITVLRDKAVIVDDSFYVVGRDDSSIYRGKNEKRKELSEIVGSIDKTRPILLLDHQPVELATAEKEGIDLQVSGHTHRGQLFPGNLITKRMFEVDFGYLKKGNLNVIVSSGYGTWGPPIRIGSRSEIVEIFIKFSGK